MKNEVKCEICGRKAHMNVRVIGRRKEYAFCIKCIYNQIDEGFFPNM